MIGTSALLIQLLPAALAAALLTFGLYRAFVARALDGVVFLIIGIVLASLLGPRLLHQVKSHNQLATLDAASIEKISLGEVVISDTESISVIAKALRNIEWFSPRNQSWGRKVTLGLSFKNGQKQQLIARYYPDPEGAVLEFTRATSSGTWHDGYAFCPDLPNALMQTPASLK